MEYSQKTADLIERMCRNIERSDFVLEKEKAEELILKTYDLFGLNRPKKVVWCKDLQDKKYQESAGSAWSAWSARSAGSAGSAWSALDYEFDYFIFGYEYYQNPDKNYLPNDNDKNYLEYCELLMQAKEAGLGYRIEWEDTLYLVPTPIVKIDALNRFHCENGPAIKWKGGQEVFMLHGVKFEEELYNKVINPEWSFEERMKIVDADQRTQAINPKFCNIDKFIVEAKGIMLDEYNKQDINGNTVNYKLYKFPKGNIFTEDAYYCYFDCPSTKKKHLEGVEVSKTVPEAMAWSQSDEKLGAIISPEDWKNMIPLVHEN